MNLDYWQSEVRNMIVSVADKIDVRSFGCSSNLTAK
jgi:hypothetical protein